MYKFIAAVSTVLSIAGANAATLEVNGDVTQSLSAKYSPITGLAIGPGARAEAAVNLIEGSVKVGGSARQTADLAYSPVTALAIGPAAVATARCGRQMLVDQVL